MNPDSREPKERHPRLPEWWVVLALILSFSMAAYLVFEWEVLNEPEGDAVAITQLPDDPGGAW